MRIIRPVEITPAILTTSSVPETDYAAWDVATAYAVGNRVLREHRIYEALVAHTGADPRTDASTPAKWRALGASNRWRMFDDRVSSQTIAQNSVAVTVTPGAVINALALINCEGGSATVSVTDPVDGLVYERTVTLIDASAEDWYAYFFGDYDYPSDVVLDDLPAYPAAAISVSVDSEGEVAVGHLAMGRLRELGVALYGTSVGIIDYSRKETDVFGAATIVKRPYSKRAEFDVAVDTPRVSFVQRELAAIRAQPVVWLGSTGIEATILFGFYRDFSLQISGPSVCDGTITVEGII